MVLSEEQKKEYLELYELAGQTIQNNFLIPKRSREEIIKDCIHYRNDGTWLMFMPEDETKDTMKSTDKPNIYLFPDGEELEVGITFNNAPATDRFENIVHSLHSNEKEELKKKLGELPPEYTTRIEKKVKTKYYAEPPKFEVVSSCQANELNDKKFDEIVEKIKEIRELGKMETIGGKNYPAETPAFDLACIRIPRNNREKFVEATKRLFDILETCLEIKSESGIKDLEIIKMAQECGYKPSEFENTRDYQALQDNILCKFKKLVPLQSLRKAIKNWKKDKKTSD